MGTSTGSMTPMKQSTRATILRTFFEINISKKRCPWNKDAPVGRQMDKKTDERMDKEGHNLHEKYFFKQ